MKTLRKVLVGSLLVFTVLATANTAALSQPLHQPQNTPFFNGLYLGLGGSIIGTHALVGNEYTGDALIRFDDSSFAEVKEYNLALAGDNSLNRLGKYGLGASAFIGYGQIINHYSYFGLELFGNYFTPTIKSSHNNAAHVMETTWVIDLFSKKNEFESMEDPIEVDEGNLVIHTKTEVKNKYSYGGAVRFGYLLSTKTMLYMLFGIDYARFEVKSNLITDISYLHEFEEPKRALITEAYSLEDKLNITNQFDKTKIGYLPGIGLETMLGDNLSLKLQYSYAFYPTIKNIVTPEISEDGEKWLPDNGDKRNNEGISYYKIEKNHTIQVKPHRSMFMVAFSYYFK